MRNKFILFSVSGCLWCCTACSSLLEICEGVNAVLNETSSSPSSASYYPTPAPAAYNPYPIQPQAPAPQRQKITRKCGSCNGTGLCARCSGTGKIEGFGIKDAKVCPVCRGLKKCQGCKGKGEY